MSKIVLPGGWYIEEDTDENSINYRCWFLCNPEGIYVANFWDGPQAAKRDVQAFAEAIDRGSKRHDKGEIE